MELTVIHHPHLSRILSALQRTAKASARRLLLLASLVLVEVPTTLASLVEVAAPLASLVEVPSALLVVVEVAAALAAEVTSLIAAALLAAHEPFRVLHEAAALLIAALVALVALVHGVASELLGFVEEVGHGEGF